MEGTPFLGRCCAITAVRLLCNHLCSYTIQVTAWAKNISGWPEYVIIGDGYAGQPSYPLVNFTGTWHYKYNDEGDSVRIKMTTWINSAKTTLVPGMRISYQELFQIINGGRGRYNAQLVEVNETQPSLRGQMRKGAFPWYMSPLNIP